jgi:NAD(P)H-hydrate epimerase
VHVSLPPLFGADGSGDAPLYSFIVDAIFGFSFDASGTGVRAPFDSLIRDLAEAGRPRNGADGIPLVSIDVPSGWVVDNPAPSGDSLSGNALDAASPKLTPSMLISLTAPKPCARGFRGKHWLGGRFVPPRLAAEYNLYAGDASGLSGDDACKAISSCGVPVPVDGLSPFPGAELVVQLA